MEIMRAGMKKEGDDAPFPDGGPAEEAPEGDKDEKAEGSATAVVSC